MPDTWAGTDHAGVNFLELNKDGTLNPEQSGRILNAVREAARRAPHVIVYPHNHYWGDARGSGAEGVAAAVIPKWCQPPGRATGCCRDARP
jgi:poly-gamma-glutamate capsule biosynthesis protein CapA/YwtB (metallophosphatase superfamily)